MSDSLEIRKVRIDPIGCYRQAFALVEGRYWLLLGISAVGSLIGGLVPVLLIGPMLCGIYLCFLEQYRGGKLEFELLFEGFDHFVQSLIASLITTGVILLLLLPGFIILFAGMFVSLASIEAEGGEAAAQIAASLVPLCATFLFFFALALVASIFFVFTFPLIVDRGLTGTQAIAVSVRAVARNFPGVLGLSLIGVVLGLVGVLACYVGSLLVTPISFAALTIAYRKLFPESGAGSALPAEEGVDPDRRAAEALPLETG